MKQSRFAIIDKNRPSCRLTPLRVHRVKASTFRARHEVAAYFSWLFSLGVSLALTGCSSSSAVPSADVPEGKMIVFEGLPHPVYESDTFEADNKSKSSVVLHGSYFYEAFQAAKDADNEELRGILNDEGAFVPNDPTTTKTCGGFHADYAVAWKQKGKVFEVLICFGCGEIKRFSAGAEQREDMASGTPERLQKVLKSYDRERPPHQGWGP